MKLKLADDLSLPLEAITETIAILGIRGSGKTNTAAVYAEELLKAGQQVVILDPTDAWWGLKSSADGQSPGYPVVVLGGKHADLPLASTDGRLVAEFVVEQRASVICSLRGFESKQQELRFVTDFLRRLYHLKGQQDAPTPLAVMIDEASRVVPQRVMGEDAASVGAVQQLVRQGRSSGFGVVLIDQRAATVNKDVLAQLEMLIVHRTTSPQDRKALREWIQQHDTEGREQRFLDSLASLKVGEAWVWSPGWLDLFVRVQVRARRTFDSSRTPRAGEVVVTPKKIADVDLEALRAKMAATIEKAKADDPAALRKKIVELERAIGAATSGRAVLAQAEANDEAIKRAVVAATRASAARIDGLEVAGGRLLRTLEQHVEKITALAGGMKEIVSMYRDAFAAHSPAEALREGWLKPVKELERALRATTPMARRPASPPRSVSSNENGNGREARVTGVEQRILNTLRALEELGIAPVDKPTAAALVGYHPNAKSYSNALGSLRTAGHVDYPTGGQVALTESGRARSASELSITSVDELHRTWFDRLGNVAQRILAPLIESYPNPRTAEDVARAAGYHPNAKSFSNMKGRLRTLGLIDYPRQGEIVATPVLFPEGLY